MERRLTVLFVLMSFVLLGGVSAAQGAIVASESWNYGDGSATSVVGQTGGTGFEMVTGWQTNSAAGNTFNADAMDPGTALSYTSGDSSVSITGGNRALRMSAGTLDNTASQLVDRGLPTAISAGTTPELFVSFLMRIGPDTDHNHDVFGTGMNNSSGRGMATVKNDQWIATPTTWGDVPAWTTEVPVPGQTYFVVARFFADATASNWEPTNPLYNRGEIWLDPNFGDAGTPEAVSLYTSSGLEVPRSLHTISSLTMATERLDPTDVVWLDEYNIGTTWGDVVVPEPMTLTFLAMGGIALLRRRS